MLKSASFLTLFFRAEFSSFFFFASALHRSVKSTVLKLSEPRSKAPELFGGSSSSAARRAGRAPLPRLIEQERASQWQVLSEIRRMLRCGNLPAVFQETLDLCGT